MIRYTLACDQGHTFESWFQNSAAYDKQVKRCLVDLPGLRLPKVEKAIMAPQLAGTRKRGAAAKRREAGLPMPDQPTHRPRPRCPKRRHRSPWCRRRSASSARSSRNCASTSPRTPTMSGQKFPEEARKMHYGETDHRSIYGEASPDQAKELHEEGIEFHPLPVLPEERN